MKLAAVSHRPNLEWHYTAVDSPYRSLQDVLNRARRGGGKWGAANPASLERQVMEQLIRSGKVERAFLGVGVRPIGPELSRTFRLPVDAGLLVENVVAGSGAAKAGLKGGDTKVVVAGESYTLGGDVIVAADGKQLATLEELRGFLATRKPGDEISLEIYRGEKQLTLHVELGRQPASPGR